ncbi:MAG: hypothetical protein KDA78_12975 [Planctomycetaceae bacterium]|nr:hypothetical protein [Planctomycetaceae bacterium]
MSEEDDRDIIDQEIEMLGRIWKEACERAYYNLPAEYVLPEEMKIDPALRSHLEEREVSLYLRGFDGTVMNGASLELTDNEILNEIKKIPGLAELSVWVDDESGYSFTDNDVRQIGDMDRLVNLDLQIERHEIQFNSLSWLQGCRSIRKLRLVSFPDATGIIPSIRGLTTLQELVLEDMELDHQSLAAIGELTDLEIFRANGIFANNNCNFMVLSNLAQLRILSLESCSISEKHHQLFSQFPCLQEASLSDTMIGDSVVTFIGRCPQLKVLLMTGCPKVTEQGLETLKGCVSLKTLYVDTSTLTPQIVRMLSEIKSLESVVAHGKATDAVAQAIQKNGKRIWEVWGD